MKTVKGIATVLLLTAVGFGRATGQTLTTLYSFDGNDGASPQAALVQGGDGNFYGTTGYGGTNNDGTVFKISPQGTLTTLHQFGSSPADGQDPYPQLVQGSDGQFYGTTFVGGTNYGWGTVFKITPQGTLTMLWQFGPNITNGANPIGGLVQGRDGSFYGTTTEGGTNNDGTYGMVFKVTSQGTLTTLWQFGGTDGDYPEGSLVQGSDGDFYGTTYLGGPPNLNFGEGYGTIFKITPQGTLTTLWQFNGTNGQYPAAGLVQGVDGNFYGTTREGGNINLNNGHGWGTVFRISPSGVFSNLHSFSGTDGGDVEAGLVQGSDGNFYGTTYSNTLFRISPSGNFTNLYSFSGSSGGADPYAGLVEGSDGNFYGTTYCTGLTGLDSGLGDGTIFKLAVPLNPPANQISSVRADSSGTNLVFSIPSVAYETYQMQFSPSVNPTNWVDVPGVCVTNSIGAMLTLTNFGGAVGPQGFYRFAITP